MPISPTTLRARIAKRLAQAARIYVRPKIKSKTLRRAMEVRVRQQSSRTTLGIVHIPHYWAVYLHDGRRGFGPSEAKRLVFFKHPSRDPRNAGGYPIRASQIRRLNMSKDAFQSAKEGGELYVRRRVGPAAGQHFFTRGMRPFINKTGPIVKSEFSKWILAGLQEDGALDVDETATGTIQVDL